MQIRVSTGDCRFAVAAALKSLEDAIAEIRTKIWDNNYQSLVDGAEHNGLLVNDERRQEMREMTDRDVEHMMSQHPGHQTVEVLKNFTDMLNYHQGDEITIDDSDFHLIKAHLPKRSEELAA